MCLLSVPSTPKGLVYVGSTESSITLSWRQSGAVDNYIVECNIDKCIVNITDVVNGSVSATVSGLSTSGAYNCVNVTAVSGHLHSDKVMLCNYTGNLFTAY